MPHRYPQLVWVIVAATIFHAIAVAGPPVPRSAEIKEYEREAPVFRSKAVAAGARLLDALDEGRSLKPWLQDGPLPAGIVCVLPVPACWWITARHADGSGYKIGFSYDGGLVYLPDGLYEANDVSRKAIGRLLAQLEDELKSEVANAERPCKYRVGTASDGGTLSGISRLFYGNAGKWKAIYEANRDIIEDPNVINGAMVLTIPADP